MPLASEWKGILSQSASIRPCFWSPNKTKVKVDLLDGSLTLQSNGFQFAMNDYQKQIRSELSVWQKQMLQRPSFINRLSKNAQVKINTWIPEKIHRAITTTIKQMIRGVLFGANYTTAKPLSGLSLQAHEEAVQQRIKFYSSTAAVEGGITGAGGILLGFADFPVLIGLKLKLLFDVCSMYGFKKLGKTAMNAYRMRLLENDEFRV